MTHRLIITVTHNSIGKWVVSQNLTAPLPRDDRPSEVFDTRADAEAHVKQLVAQNGDPNMVNIIWYDNQSKPAP